MSYARSALWIVALAAVALLGAGCGGGDSPDAPDRHAMGDSDAPVTVVTFDDYQ